MKYLKTFESENNENKIVINFANYVIHNSGLKKYNDGFMDYSILDYKKYSEYYTYFFKFDTEMFGDYKIGIDKLKTFLKSIGAKDVKKRKWKDDRIEITFSVERDKAKELAEIYISTNKYNL